MAVLEVSLGEELLSVGRQSTSVMYQFVKLSARFDSSTEWALAGFATPAHWIAEKLEVDVSTAREWIRIGKALEDLPFCDLAFREKASVVFKDQVTDSSGHT